MTKTAAVQKVRYSKCKMCQCLVEMTALYDLLGKKMCLRCGNQQIAIWNNAVKEFEQSVSHGS